MLYSRYFNILILCFFFCGQVFLIPSQAFFNLGDFGIKEEKEMGRKFEVLIRSKLPLVEDPEVALYVKSIVQRISNVIPPQPFHFTSGIILHNALNAFAVPGGHIFIFTGLIMQLDNEAELAGIIAHEMAHVTQRHVADRINRGKYLGLASLLLAIAGIAAGGGGEGGAVLATGAIGVGQAAMLNYSRADETDADDIGYQYLIAAGYPPLGMVGGFKKIREKSFMTGGGGLPTYLSTHPAIDARITSALAKAHSEPPSLAKRQINNARFKRVQLLLWARYGNINVAKHRFSLTNDALSLMGRAMVFARENKIQEADNLFNKAILIKPTDALILREAGIFHYKKGNTSKAEQYLIKAMELEPSDYMAQFFYARLLDTTKRSQMALPYYQKVLKILPQDTEVNIAYARSLANSGKKFLAYLYLSYGYLYSNHEKKTEQYRDKADKLAKGQQEKKLLKKFDKIYKERKEIWEEGL